MHRHRLIGQIAALIRCILRCTVTLPHLFPDQRRIVIAVHIDSVLYILDLVGRGQKLRIRRDHRTAGKHDRAAAAGSPFIVRRPAGDEILDRDVFLSVIHFGKIGPDA